MTITGTHIHYFFICKTKLWLFHHKVFMEGSSDEVLIGKIIDQFAYSREKEKNLVKVPGGSIDIVKFGDKVVIKEIKKSEKNFDAAKNQIIYYAYLLRKYGIRAELGIILIPRKFKKVQFVIRDGDLSNMEKVIKEVNDVISKEKPPQPVRRPICRKCAYREFCWG